MNDIYKQSDKIDTLTHDQLDLIARTDCQLLLHYIEKNTIFDVHRIRLMLEIGSAEAKRRMESLRSNHHKSTAPQASGESPS